MTDPTYDLQSIKLPRFAGAALKLFVGLIESPLTRWLLIPSLLKQGGILKLRQTRIEASPTYLPLHPVPASAAETVPATPKVVDSLVSPEPPDGSFHFPSIEDYARAYREGRTTPEAVAERVNQAIAASNAAEPPLRAIIASDAEDVRRQASHSAELIRVGTPRSIFEGVPIAVKDEFDALPYTTRVGTRFMGQSPAKEDATVVRRLREAGALIIGKANMHEIGIGVTGHNPHNGTPRNPYDPGHYTGGSSSGPAASAAAGLCPAAVGADGGGSIRIPSAFCGLVGIKGTFGRTSSFGSTPLTWSNDQLGPLAGNAVDAARMYAVMAGPDPNDPNTLCQPAPSLMDVGRADLDGITLGVYWPWFEHASAEIVTACKEMLNALQGRGATVKEVTIPDLDTARIGHLVSITSEMLNALAKYDREHFKEYSLEVQTNLTLAKAFTAPDYLQALKARTEAMAHFREALTWVDVIVTPTTGVTAPIIPPDALPDGESDLTTLLAIIRFATPANFTGLPAISFPAGNDSGGLPIGFQVMGRPWEEHVLLRLALMAETMVVKRQPKIYYDVLGKMD